VLRFVLPVISRPICGKRCFPEKFDRTFNQKGKFAAIHMDNVGEEKGRKNMSFCRQEFNFQTKSFGLFVVFEWHVGSFILWPSVNTFPTHPTSLRPSLQQINGASRGEISKIRTRKRISGSGRLLGLLDSFSSLLLVMRRRKSKPKTAFIALGVRIIPAGALLRVNGDFSI